MIPLAYCLWSSHFVARYRFLAVDAQDCLQVQDDTGRARYCDICKLLQADRMYHDYTLDKCLPLFDHHCPWWYGSVWRDNKKAYMLFLAMITIHLSFCLGVSIWVMVDPRFKAENPHIGFLLVDGLFLLYSLGLTVGFALTNIVWNISGSEKEQGTVWYKLPSGTIVEWKLTTESASKSPWNMGWRENFHLTMGRKRDLFFFWKPIPMVAADPLPTRDLTADLPSQDVELQEIGPSSRNRRSAVQSSSTGYGAEASSRRRRTTDDT